MCKYHLQCVLIQAFEYTVYIFSFKVVIPFWIVMGVCTSVCLLLLPIGDLSLENY